MIKTETTALHHEGHEEREERHLFFYTPFVSFVRFVVKNL